MADNLDKKRRRLKDKDVETFRRVKAGESQSDIAREEGVDRAVICRRVKRVDEVYGAEWLQEKRNKIAGLADKAIDGYDRHLDEKLPNPTVLNGLMTGLKILTTSVEVTGNLTVEQITARRESSLAAGLEKFGKKR